MTTRLREQERVQGQVAQAEAQVTCSNATAEVWEILRSGDQRARVLLATTHAVASSVKAVECMFRAGGASSIHSANPHLMAGCVTFTPVLRISELVRSSSRRPEASSWVSIPECRGSERFRPHGLFICQGGRSKLILT